MMRANDVRHRTGLIALSLALVFQLVWALGRGVTPAALTLVIEGVAVALAVVAVRDRHSRTTRVVARVMAGALALEFAGAVADRFGLLGAPGDRYVSWGNWSAFERYTARLLPGFPHPLVSAAAVLATAAEIVLAVLLLVGRRRREVGTAAAGLLAVYVLAMLPTVGPDDVAFYGVPSLFGAALLVSAVPAWSASTAMASGRSRLLSGRR